MTYWQIDHLRCVLKAVHLKNLLKCAKKDKYYSKELKVSQTIVHTCHFTLQHGVLFTSPEFEIKNGANIAQF